MKAISLWQPWATLWLLSDPDEKVFETRSWYTSHRGDLLVHATKKKDREVLEAVYSPEIIAALIRHGIHGLEDLVFGAVIGKVRLTGCCRMDSMPEPAERERAFGLWEPERYAWERGPRPVIFKVPIAYRGAQQLFQVPDTLLVNQRERTGSIVSRTIP